MHRLALAAALPVAGVVAAGCSHEAKQVKPSRCSEARVQAWTRVPHAIRGDVDGDGVPDTVALVRLRRAPDPCGAFLVVRTGNRVLTRALVTDYSPPYGSQVPRLNGLAGLTSRSRLHIVVTLAEGASTAFAQVFSVEGGRILAMPIRGPDAGGFSYWGSGTHYGGVDCVKGRPGLIVESTFSTLASSRQLLYRDFYRLHGDNFELARKQVITRITGALSRSSRGAQPFPTCMRVRAAS
jgi:hypothetical protein